MDELKLEWTPEPHGYPAEDSEAFILSQEHLTNLVKRITVKKGDEAEESVPEPQSLRGKTPEGKPPFMTISSDKTTLTVEVANWVGLFPISISFMEDDPSAPHGWGKPQVAKRVTDFKDVPAKHADIVDYKASGQNVYTIPLVVQALASKDASEPEGKYIEEVVYTITVYANYDIGKELLKAKVEERKG